MVDEVWSLRNEKFSEFGVKDYTTPQAVVNLEPLVLKMRSASRKSNYLSNSIEDANIYYGKQLHESMKSSNIKNPETTIYSECFEI